MKSPAARQWVLASRKSQRRTIDRDIVEARRLKALEENHSRQQTTIGRRRVFFEKVLSMRKKVSTLSGVTEKELKFAEENIKNTILRERKTKIGSVKEALEFVQFKRKIFDAIRAKQPLTDGLKSDVEKYLSNLDSLIEDSLLLHREARERIEKENTLLRKLQKK